MAVDRQPQSSPANPGLSANIPREWPEEDRSGTFPTAGPRIAADDMDSDPAELPQLFPQSSTTELAVLLDELRAPLVEYRGSQRSLIDVYRQWDAEAQRKQTQYLWLVRWSGIAAFAAVMLAILQLPQLEWEQYGFSDWPPLRMLMDALRVRDLHGLFEVAEVVSAVLALVAVLIGIRAAYSHLWQLRRLQAEQCRFLKFGYLLRCGRSLEEARRFLQDGVHRLVRLDTDSSPQTIAKRWVRGELKLTPMPRTQSPAAAGGFAPLMIEYFLKKRLRFQAKYFKGQAHRREFKEKLLWWLPVSAFFLSLGLAFAHAAITVYEKHAVAHPPPAQDGPRPTPVVQAGPAPSTAHRGHHNTAALLCLLGAAGLPALAAWVRTYRGALEFARNANRFHGMWIQLYDAEQELQHRNTQSDMPGQFEVLRDVELALESEHRAWMRLMVEAEWFG